MPSIKVAVPHKLTQDEALRRIKKAIAEAKKQNSDKVSELKESWDGYEGEFSGAAMGYDVGGGIGKRQPDDRGIEVDRPFHVAREDQDMRETSRAHERRVGT